SRESGLWGRVGRRSRARDLPASSRGAPARPFMASPRAPPSLLPHPDVRRDRIAERAVGLLLTAPLVLDRLVRITIGHERRRDAARTDVVLGVGVRIPVERRVIDAHHVPIVVMTG